MRFARAASLIVSALLVTSCSTKQPIDLSLPDYMMTDSPVLHEQGKDFTFPLTKEDLKDLALLEAKFDSEKNCAGLAAAQIGIGKRAIIFAAPDDPELKKFRKDFVQTMPKTLWLNPSFSPIGIEMTKDWEACFSVKGIVGLVPRYKKVRYMAWTKNGQKVTGIAEGFLARIIQHEIDHSLGILFTSKAVKIMSMDAYRTMRTKQISGKKS